MPIVPKETHTLACLGKKGKHEKTPGYKLLGLEKHEGEKILRVFPTVGDSEISQDQLKDILELLDFKLSPKGKERDLEIIMKAAGVVNGVDNITNIKKKQLSDFLDLNSTGGDVNTHVGLGSHGEALYKDWGFLKTFVGILHSGDIATLETVDAAWTFSVCGDSGIQLVIFIPLISFIQVALFVYMEYLCGDDCGETPSQSVLAYRPCCRSETWRWVTYSLVHSNWTHLLQNMFLQWAFGLYLEVINGPITVIIVYACGALAASMASSIAQPSKNVVGASGADYALVGAWFAHVAINWDTMSPMKYKIGAAQLLLLVYEFTATAVTDDTSVSYSAHFGGFMFGVVYGAYALKNSRVCVWDVFLGWFGITLAVSGIIFGFCYNVYSDPDIDQSCGELHQCAWVLNDGK